MANKYKKRNENCELDVFHDTLYLAHLECSTVTITTINNQTIVGIIEDIDDYGVFVADVNDFDNITAVQMKHIVSASFRAKNKHAIDPRT